MAADTSDNPGNQSADAQAAANIVRQKVARLYAEEPGATTELAESEQAPQRSKHQQFMYELNTSGKDLATIQTEWHNYYQNLPADEKHQVWQEFYSSQSSVTGKESLPEEPAQVLAKHKEQVVSHKQVNSKARKLRDARSKDQMQAAIRDKVTAGGKLKAKHHLQSLLFGLGMGFIVLIIFLFSFFNEVVIAPFIQPSRTSANTPLIVGTDSVAATSTPEVIIPKINVEIPTDYSQNSTNEADIENALESGVVHYPTTAQPGQKGNAAFFGHSSNNIFNKGKYKFAFVLLHTLVPGDTFYLTNNGKVYVYKVISKNVVPPSQISVLDPVPGQVATATLITCDPPGTSLNRLIIVGQQISPDPSGNGDATPVATSSTPTASALPGNGPTLGTRLLRSTIGKIGIVVALVIAFLGVVRWINKPLRGYK